MPTPHITYHVAEHYEEKEIGDILIAVSGAVSPFPVQANGLGVFTGIQPIIHIPVVRSPQLAALHERLWNTLAQICLKTNDNFAPKNWFPHITLTSGNHTDANLGPMLAWLAQQDRLWEIQVDNLALLRNTDEPQLLIQRFPF